MLEHVRPQYAKAFRCIGSDCEDTCCHGLDVVIDKPAYERLHSLGDFQSRLKEHFVIVNQPNDFQFARIKLTQSFSCPFLSQDRLCGIQQEHGEYYLSNVCATYPRVTQRIDGLSETALLLSCPEAARLVLLNEDLARLDEEDLPRYRKFSRLNNQDVRANGSPHQYLWDIRGFTLLLLHDRSYPLWQRLFILGLFCKRLDEITAARQLGLVRPLLKQYAEIITLGQLRLTMEGIPVRGALQLSTVMNIVNRQLALTDISHVRFRECVQDFLQGIQWTQDSSLESCAATYEEANTRFYQPFMDHRPHILENYLVNHIFRTRFPYGVDPQGNLNAPFTEYLVMCVLYAVVKGLLIGVAGKYQESFTEAHVVKVIQSFAKAVEHCPNLVSAQSLGLANVDGIALLLKNDR